MKTRFRVWDGSKMVYPVGDDRYWLDFYRGGREWTLCESDSEAGRWVAAHSDDLNASLMCSTGLTDAEDTEVWEGDYLQERDGDLWRVYWVSGMFAVQPVRSERWEACQSLGWLLRKKGNLEVTVIGNRYEHPELTEKVSA